MFKCNMFINRYDVPTGKCCYTCKSYVSYSHLNLLMNSLLLGAHVSTCVLHLLSTILVLIRLLHLLAPTITVSICNGNSENFPSDELHTLDELLPNYLSQIEAARIFYEVTAKKYPLVYTTLELGSSWGHVVCKMLGISENNDNLVHHDYLLMDKICQLLYD